MRRWAIVMAAAGLATSVPLKAQAQSYGTWRVNGSIAGRAFVLNCRLDQKVCVDASGKRTHQLVSVTAPAANRLSWSFRFRVMLMNVTLNFDGGVNGDRMSGTMRAAGQQGTFTAARG